MGRKEGDAAATVTLRRHAAQHTATLLRRLAYEVGRAAKSGDAKSIHDLRVAIRRLSQCLRVFEPFFPRAKAKKIRRALKQMIDLASEVRNRDVAASLLVEAKVSPESELARAVTEGRGAAQRKLVSALRQWMRNSSFRKWRSALDL
jgi:CHAD domain-containing protein